MPSEEWIALIPNEKDRKYAREAVIAALESEREEEVVLAEFNIRREGKDTDICWFSKHGCIVDGQCPDFWGMCVDIGRRGPLIFRPDTKGGK